MRGRATPEQAAARRRLVLLMGARLVVAGLALAVALALVGAGPEGSGAAERGLYGTMAAAFALTAGYAAVLGRMRRLRVFAGVQVATDLALVTAIVTFSGASASPFGFLYVPITVAAAALFGRAGAYGTAVAAALGYGAVLVAAGEGWLPGGAAGVPAPPLQLASWGVHTGALLLVALLSSALSSERDRAGRALDERTRDLFSLRHLYARTVESLTSGLLTTDLARRVTSFNPEAERITGARAADVLGRPLERVIPGAVALIQKPGPEDGGGRLRARIVFRDHQERERHLGLASSILREADGQPCGHVLIFQDVTQVVEMERQLRRQERLAAAGELSARLAHEIRNPLAAISGSIQILQSQPEKPEAPEGEASRLMSIVLRETDRLDALIGEFLQYARPEPPRCEAVALKPVLSDVARLFESVRPPDVKLSLEVPEPLRLRADARQLRQLFWNLFRNAVDAMPEGGELRVTARREPPQEERVSDRNEDERSSPWVEVCVADSGVGIADDVVDRIFDPFFTTKPHGTGLGLATVHRIVEGCGGEMRVQSRPGAGTRFRMRFPAA